MTDFASDQLTNTLETTTEFRTALASQIATLTAQLAQLTDQLAAYDAQIASLNAAISAIGNFDQAVATAIAAQSASLNSTQQQKLN